MVIFCYVRIFIPKFNQTIEKRLSKIRYDVEQAEHMQEQANLLLEKSQKKIEDAHRQVEQHLKETLDDLELKKKIQALNHFLKHDGDSSIENDPVLSSIEPEDLLYPLLNDIVRLKSDTEKALEHIRQMNSYLEKNIQKRTEESKIKESNLRAILDSTDDDIYLINHQYEIIDYNSNFEDNFYARFGVQLEKGRNIFEMMPPEYEDLKRISKKRIDKALQGYQRTYYDRLNISFYESITEVKLYPIRSNTKKVVGVTIFSKDITEQKRSEELIQQNQQLLSSINRNIKEGLYRSTPTKGMVYVNQAFVEMFGFASEEEAILSPSASLYVDANRRKELVEFIENSGKGPNITSFSRIRSAYVEDPDLIFIILSIKHKVYSQKNPITLSQSE
jgi:PAS domain S-box-containing protein